jgi:TPR repeat protein
VIDLYDRACGWGFLPGCTDVARLYEDGSVVARDENRARELYRSTCMAGEPGACVRLGQVPGNSADTMRLYEQACTESVTLGCAKLAALYAGSGAKGATADLPKAVSLYERGCKAGDGAACAGLAEMQRLGRGTPRNEGRALTLYERACDGKVASACTQAAHMYRQIGRSSTAQDLYKRGCDLGDVAACRWRGWAK